MTTSRTTNPTAEPKPRVLVVVDQLLIGMQIASELRDLGCEVIGPAHSLDKANDLLQQSSIDAAVLSFELDFATTEQFAKSIGRSCPVLFVSVHNSDRAPAELKTYPWLQKPFSHEELALAVRQLLAKDNKCQRGVCPCMQSQAS